MEQLEKQKILQIYRKMVEIRKFEEKLYELFLTRRMPGSMHQYDGQEAVAVGVCANLEENDYITSTHRGHGHYIAKGGDINLLMAEIFAKRTGCSKGMGGSMHLTDIENGLIATNGIVAGGIPIAVGAGWTCDYLKNGHVAVAFFGDGAANEGAFHESLNMASAWNLPVVFICENNLYAYTTHYKRTTVVDDIASRAKGYGMDGIVADGMDVVDVYKKSGIALQKAKEGGGPTLIECKTYRFKGHSRLEKSSYRTKEELAFWKEHDPIKKFSEYAVMNEGISAEELSFIEKEVAEVMKKAVEFAEGSPDTASDDYKKYIYA